MEKALIIIPNIVAMSVIGHETAVAASDSRPVLIHKYSVEMRFLDILYASVTVSVFNIIRSNSVE